MYEYMVAKRVCILLTYVQCLDPFSHCSEMSKKPLTLTLTIEHSIYSVRSAKSLCTSAYTRVQSQIMLIGNVIYAKTAKT